MAKAAKYVYLFGNKKADGNGGMKPLLGGKGANLAEMSRIGLPVPPGFTITTEVCTHYYKHHRSYPKELDGQVKTVLAGPDFGAPEESRGYLIVIHAFKEAETTFVWIAAAFVGTAKCPG